MRQKFRFNTVKINFYFSVQKNSKNYDNTKQSVSLKITLKNGKFLSKRGDIIKNKGKGK